MRFARGLGILFALLMLSTLFVVADGATTRIAYHAEGDFTRLVIDGKVIAGTQQIVSNATYGTSAGTTLAMLAGGTHQILIQYRTTVSFAFDPGIDWQGAALQVMAFDQ